MLLPKYYKRYKNMSCVFTNKTKGHRFCVYSRVTKSWWWRIIADYIISSWCNNYYCHKNKGKYPKLELYGQCHPRGVKSTHTTELEIFDSVLSVMNIATIIKLGKKNGCYKDSPGNDWWCLSINLHGLFGCLQKIYTTCIHLWHSFFTIREEGMVWYIHCW